MTTKHRDKDVERFDQWASAYEIPGCNEPFLIGHIKQRLPWQQVSSISL